MALHKAAARRPRGESTRARPATKSGGTWAPVRPNDDTRPFAILAAGAALEKKALDPLLLDLRGKSDYTDYLLLLSAESARQVDAIARAVEERLATSGLRRRSLEAAGESHWLLMDFGDLVVHVFFRDARSFYDLEGLWADAKRVPLPHSSTHLADG
jgi:ribosome-associated protein